MKGILAAATFVVVVSLMGAPARAASIVLPRAGQVGAGIQFQGGGLAQTGELGNEFGTGVGFGAVRIKFRSRYDRAIGLSFESRRLDGRGRLVKPSAFSPGAGADSLVPLTALSLQTYGLDGYQFFGARTRTSSYLSASVGIATINAWERGGDPVYPLNTNDGLYVGAGAGVERFIYRSWAVDFSARYAAIILDGSTNHDVQVALGMIFYAAY